MPILDNFATLLGIKEPDRPITDAELADLNNPKTQFLLFMHSIEPNLGTDLSHSIRYTNLRHLELFGPYAFALMQIIG